MALNYCSLHDFVRNGSASGWLLAGAPKFHLRIALLCLAALAAFAFGLRAAKTDAGKAGGIAVFLLLFCLLAASETLGRELFFSTIVRM